MHSGKSTYQMFKKDRFSKRIYMCIYIYMCTPKCIGVEGLFSPEGCGYHLADL